MYNALVIYSADVQSIHYHLTDHPVNYGDALEYIRKGFDRFINLTINRDTIKDLYIHKVITHAEKLQIQDLKVQDRMEHLLDYVIIRSLNAKTGQKFIAFINVLQKSDDTSMNRMASDMTHNLFQ